MPAKWQRWMPMEIDALRASPAVQAMHPSARAGYIWLLLDSWQTDDCTIPSDQLDLAEKSGLGDELWAIHGPRILRKFDPVDGTDRLRNQVCYEKWLDAKRIFEARKKAADKTNTVRPPRQPEVASEAEKQRARWAVNDLVKNGSIKPADALPCVDCGHLYDGNGNRHEYDHFLGYQEENQTKVEAVCLPCHQKREVRRGRRWGTVTDIINCGDRDGDRPSKSTSASRSAHTRTETETETETSTSTQTKAKKQKPTPKASPSSLVVPPWIPEDSWNGFVESRKKLRAPLTERATALIVGKLQNFEAQGMPAGDVLDQSIERGWVGVFELKSQTGGTTHVNGNGKKSQTEQQHAHVQAAILNLTSTQDSGGGGGRQIGAGAGQDTGIASPAGVGGEPGSLSSRAADWGL